MFNSPINPLFGISAVGKDGNSKQKDNKDNNKNQNKGESKNIFEASDEFENLSLDEDNSFDTEKYIRNYLDNLKEEYSQNLKVLSGIDNFLSKFELKRFYKKYGKDLSKEDLKIILYEIIQEFLN